MDRRPDLDWLRVIALAGWFWSGVIPTGNLTGTICGSSATC